MTVFGGMTPDDDKAELQDIDLLGRWACWRSTWILHCEIG